MGLKIPGLDCSYLWSVLYHSWDRDVKSLSDLYFITLLRSWRQEPIRSLLYHPLRSWEITDLCFITRWDRDVKSLPISALSLVEIVTSRAYPMSSLLPVEIVTLRAYRSLLYHMLGSWRQEPTDICYKCCNESTNSYWDRSIVTGCLCSTHLLSLTISPRISLTCATK